VETEKVNKLRNLQEKMEHDNITTLDVIWYLMYCILNLFFPFFVILCLINKKMVMRQKKKS